MVADAPSSSPASPRAGDKGVRATVLPTAGNKRERFSPQNLETALNRPGAKKKKKKNPCRPCSRFPLLQHPDVLQGKSYPGTGRGPLSFVPGPQGFPRYASPARNRHPMTWLMSIRCA